MCGSVVRDGPSLGIDSRVGWRILHPSKPLARAKKFRPDTMRISKRRHDDVMPSFGIGPHGAVRDAPDLVHPSIENFHRPAASLRGMGYFRAFDV